MRAVRREGPARAVLAAAGGGGGGRWWPREERPAAGLSALSCTAAPAGAALPAEEAAGPSPGAGGVAARSGRGVRPCPAAAPVSRRQWARGVGARRGMPALSHPAAPARSAGPAAWACAHLRARGAALHLPRAAGRGANAAMTASIPASGGALRAFLRLFIPLFYLWAWNVCRIMLCGAAHTPVRWFAVFYFLGIFFHAHLFYGGKEKWGVGRR